MQQPARDPERGEHVEVERVVRQVRQLQPGLPAILFIHLPDVDSDIEELDSGEIEPDLHEKHAGKQHVS